MKKYLLVLMLLIVIMFNNNLFAGGPPPSCTSTYASTADAFCNAPSVTQDGACYSGTNVGSTACLSGGCSNAGDQFFIQFTATTAAAIINFTSTGITNADVALITNGAACPDPAYTSACPVINSLCIEICNTTAAGGPTNLNPIDLVPGETYYIMIETDNGTGDAGTFDICITTNLCRDGIQNNGETAVDCGGPNCAPCSVVNDDCNNSIPMVLNNTLFIGSGATNTCTQAFCNDPGTDDCYTNGCTLLSYMSCGSIENNTWYTFTPAVTDSFFFSLLNQICGNNQGMQMWIGTLPSGCGDAQTYNEIYCQSTATPNDITTTLYLTAGVTYTITLDGFAGDDCTFDFGVYSVNPILPVELVRYEGNYLPDKKSTMLEWKTTSEINNDYFTIEKSTDGDTYEVLDIVQGAGNSNSLLSYRLEDQNPAQGVTYYRLKQTDYDFVSKYKGVVAVNVSDEGDIKLYPTVTTTNVNLDIFFALPTYTSIMVYNVAGAIVFEDKVELGRGRSSYVIPSETYDAGIYYVSITSVTNPTEKTSLKFIKN